jgi:hypothetical protein
MDPGNEYLACYWGYVGGKAKRDVDEIELEKRCGKTKRDLGDELSTRNPEPLTDLRNMYLACYSAYVSQKVKRGEELVSAELEKRCGKAKRDELKKRVITPEPLVEVLSDRLGPTYQQSYAAYSVGPAKVKREAAADAEAKAPIDDTSIVIGS